MHNIAVAKTAKVRKVLGNLLYACDPQSGTLVSHYVTPLLARGAWTEIAVLRCSDPVHGFLQSGHCPDG
jgi:hypothetical protein